MIIAWPDQWYHTSGDRVDKADPTQMKRVAIIGAAGAYTVASADDNMAIKIAGETASNGTRRLGHQFVLAQEVLNHSTVETLGEDYKLARTCIEGTILNEKATLESILELAEDEKVVGDYIKEMQQTIDGIGQAHLGALETHMQAVAARLGTQPVRIRLTDLENRASRMIPRPTSRVRENGYRGYRQYISQVPEEESAKYPYTRGEIANTNEVQLLINGRNSVLDIKKQLDAQYRRSSDLQAIINYIEILKLAGLVEM